MRVAASSCTRRTLASAWASTVSWYTAVDVAGAAVAVPATIVAVIIPAASAVAWSIIICWAISVALITSACVVAVAAPAVARACSSYSRVT